MTFYEVYRLAYDLIMVKRSCNQVVLLQKVDDAERVIAVLRHKGFLKRRIVMKTNKNVNYKVRLWVDEEGELHGISFGNRQIPMGLFGALNDAMHEVVDRFNGKTAWKENYIKFTDNGKRYEQFDGKDANTPCTDCVFRGKRCQHPHYHDGSKGYCGKPYREVKTEEQL